MAKTANLLTDGYGGPDRLGLLLPLHWQAVCFLLGGVAAGATVVVATSASDLAGCPLAFVAAADAEAALDAGVDDVLACSLTPFGTRLASVPPMVLDAALEIPSYGDHFGGRPTTARIELGGRPFTWEPLDVGPADRVLTALDPATPAGLAALLGTLQTGAALVLLAGSASTEPGTSEAVTTAVRAESVTAAIRAESVTAVVTETGLRRV